MADLGRWTGGAKTQGNLPEVWTAPASLFDTQQRNDSSIYGWAAATSILTLPSSGLADGYLVIGAFKYVDTSNGRFNPQGRFVLNSGTGNFVSAYTGGYNRDNSEDTSYVRTWAFIDGPSASAQIQFQWKADSDDATGGTSWSCLEVIPFYYSDIGLYSSTDHSQYGGVSPNQIVGLSGTNGTNITLASNTVTMAGDNKTYLCLGSYFFEGRGGRTQRWGGFRIDGTKADYAKAYSYYRNTANDESGEMFSFPIRTATANRTVDLFCYRGDGVAAGQGGANIDGTDPGVGQHALVVIELNDSAECFAYIDDLGGIDLNVTGPVDQTIARTSGEQFIDSGSFSRASDTAIQSENTTDLLLGANVSAAQEVVSTTSRWTAGARFTVNGAEDNDTESGDYARNNQGSTDTFGWSANLISYVETTALEDVGVSVQELAGGEDGGRYEVQPNWTGFWGVNLDTLEDTGGVTLTVQETAHGHTAENTVLSHKYSLSTNQTEHGLISDNVVLSHSYTLAPNQTDHDHQADGTVLTHKYNLSPVETFHGLTSENVTLSGSVDLVVQSTQHSHVAESPVLDSSYSLSIQDTAHGLTSDQPTLTHKYSLSLEDGLHGLISDSPTLDSSYLLSASETLHGHTSDNTTLSQSISLVVSSGNHAHTADVAILSHRYDLTTAETVHGQTADNVTLGFGISLSVNSADHTHEAESVALSHKYSLSPSEAIHGLISDNVDLSTSLSLNVQDGAHGHVSEGTTLSHKYSLLTNDGLHSHISDNVNLSPGFDLVPENTVHGHATEGPSISHRYLLTASDAVHGHTADQLGGLSSLSVITVQNGFHGHTSTGVTIPLDEVVLVSAIAKEIEIESHICKEEELQTLITKDVSLLSNITKQVGL